MKSLLIILSAFLLVLIACNKNNQVKVSYEATGAISSYSVNYLENGLMQEITVNPQSAQYSWNHSFIGEQGDIVYISGKYNDPNSALKMMIKIDGKIYKQASNQGDTLKYLVVSGVVPYK